MPNQGRSKLKKGDITINELLKLSLSAYEKNEIDNKRKRMNEDVVSAKLTARYGMKYNPSNKTWEQSEKKQVKITFIVKSEPTSYKDISGLKSHFYPVTFLIRDLDLGMDSPFRFRTGSLKKPKIAKKGKKLTEKDRKNIAKYNIKNGVQLQFFFHLEWVLDKYGLLYGINYANRPPKVTNKNLVPYFDKTSLFVVINVLRILLTTKKNFVLNKLFKK